MYDITYVSNEEIIIESQFMYKRYISQLYLINSFLIFLVFFFSCSDESSNNLPQQTNKHNQSITNREDSIKFANLNVLESSNTVNYILDTVKSKVLWAIDKHNGYVKFSSGKIGVLHGKVLSGAFTVCMDSIVDLDIDYQLMKGTLEKILKSTDFFNTAKYPYSIFKTDSVKKLTDNKYFITGYMKIFNVIRKVSFNSNIQIKKDSLIAKSEKFSIDRTKWGLTAYTKDHIENEEGFIVPNDINLIISLVAYKK